MKDVMTALREVVVGDAAIAALVSDRVYVNRIPRATIEAEDTFHPQKMLVLRQAGGNGKSDTTPVEASIVTALCYGESDLEADKVQRAVRSLFVHLTRAKGGDEVLIHHINPTGGVIPLVDPDIVWPAVAQSYEVTADVEEDA